MRYGRVDGAILFIVERAQANGLVCFADGACGVGPSTAAPLFGLGDTRMEPDAFAENDLKPAHFTVPRSRLSGRKAFTIKRTVGPDGGCPRRELYTRCTETGGLTLTLHFKRAHAG